MFFTNHGIGRGETYSNPDLNRVSPAEMVILLKKGWGRREGKGIPLGCGR